MKYISVPEFGRIQRSELGNKLLRRLQKFDESRSRANQRCVFDFGYLHFIKALNYVGVIQVPGLIVEILPKIDTSPSDGDEPYKRNDKQRVLSQNNLLYMLSLTRKIPARDKDLANLHLQKLPLLEIIVIIFIAHLLDELRKGSDSSYIHKEENAKFLKGKLLLSQHIRRNAAHNERVFVGYDEFISDSWLNRIFKAACYKLINMVGRSRTQQRLREAILLLREVSDYFIEEHHFEKVHLNRNTERFSTLLGFCKIIFQESAPTPSQGKKSTFSLLFPMETLFEEFIARFIYRYCYAFNLKRNMIHIQAKNMRKWLLRDSHSAGKFRMKPDIVIDGGSDNQRIVIDTKWKRLSSNLENSYHGVSQADIYQLYAYAKRYDSPNNILLYPKVEGVSPKGYHIFNEKEKKIRIEMINLNRNLLKKRLEFQNDLQNLING